MSASVYSDASCQTSYQAGYDLSSVAASGCTAYGPAVNPLNFSYVGASCTANMSSPLVYMASVAYSSGPLASTCAASAGGAHLSLYYQASTAQSCLPATLYVFNVSGSTVNSTRTSVYMTMSCQVKPNSAAGLGSNGAAPRRLLALLLLAAAMSISTLVL